MDLSEIKRPCIALIKTNCHHLDEYQIIEIYQFTIDGKNTLLWSYKGGSKAYKLSDIPKNFDRIIDWRCYV